MKAAAVVLLLLAAGAPVHAGTPGCSEGGDVPISLAEVDDRLDLHLVDGRTLRLVGLEAAGATPGDPDGGGTARGALAGLLAGHALAARLLSDKADRWGRVPALVFRTDETVAGGLAALAIARGLGRYRPEPAAHPCRDALLAAETEARSGALGLWRDPYYGVVAVDDRDAFAERAATTVVAEGRLRRVEAGPFRTKLRFAAPGETRRDLLAAVVSPKVVKRFGEAGVHFEALVGRRLRMRGLLDLRFGPQIEIADPDALEILAVGAEPARPAP